MKRLEKSLRGWLPQEPVLPARAAPSQVKSSKAKAFFQGIAVILVVAGVFCTLLVLSDSWIKPLILGLTIMTGLLWLVFHGKVRSALKSSLVAVMIFAIILTAVEGYLFWNGGYPSTYTSSEPTITLSIQKMLNASVEQIANSAENTQTFSLLKLEHGNDIGFESMKLWPTDSPIRSGGSIAVDFASKTSSAYFHFFSDSGHQFVVEPTIHVGQLISQQYHSSQTADQALAQIDALGLNWFYNRALELAQNRTANLPSIDYLNIEVAYGRGAGSYQGITMLLTGFHKTVMTNGSRDYNGVIIADFQPDGTLIYMTQPQPRT